MIILKIFRFSSGFNLALTFKRILKGKTYKAVQFCKCNWLSLLHMRIHENVFGKKDVRSWVYVPSYFVTNMRMLLVSVKYNENVNDIHVFIEFQQFSGRSNEIKMYLYFAIIPIEFKYNTQKSHSVGLSLPI